MAEVDQAVREKFSLGVSDKEEASESGADTLADNADDTSKKSVKSTAQKQEKENNE